MPAKKKTVELEEGDAEQKPVAPEEAEEEPPPVFEFPTEVYGVEWSTVQSSMLYWAKFVEGAFTYDGTDYENSFAVASDDGEFQVVSQQDFTDHWQPVSTQTHHEPSYIERQKQEQAAEAAEEAEDKD